MLTSQKRKGGRDSSKSRACAVACLHFLFFFTDATARGSARADRRAHIAPGYVL